MKHGISDVQFILPSLVDGWRTFRVNFELRRDGYLALPPATGESLRDHYRSVSDQQRVEAEGTFGFRVRPGAHCEATTSPTGYRGGKFFTVAHRDGSDFDMARLMMGIDAPVAVLLRRVPPDTSGLLCALKAAKEEYASSALYAEFIRRCAAHYLGQTPGRELIITGPQCEGPEGYEDSSPYQGKPLTPEQLAFLLWECASGTPAALHPPQPGEQALAYANACLSLEEGGYTVRAENSWHCALWALFLNHHYLLEKVLQLPVDLYLYLEKLENNLYLRYVVARAWGTPAKLTDIGLALGGITKCERIPSSQLEHRKVGNRVINVGLHYATLPGSPYPPPLSPVSIPDWQNFFQLLATSTDAGRRNWGDMPIGPTADGRQLFWADNRAVVITGPQNRGKTILATTLAFCQSHRVIYIRLSNKNGAPKAFVRNLGGQCLTINSASPTMQVEWDQAVAEIEADVERQLNEWEGEWGDSLSFGLPLVIQPGTGANALYCYWLTKFSQRLRGIVSRILKKSGERVVVVFDDLAALQGETPDQHLGQVVVDRADELRKVMHEFATTGRELGFSVIFCAHSEKEFALFPSGMWGAISLWLRFPPQTGHQKGEIWIPHEPRDDAWGEKVGDFNPRMPRQLLGIIEGRATD